MSRGQLARNSWNFPTMNDRGGRRRVRRALARAHRFAEQINRAYEAGIVSEAWYRAKVGVDSQYSQGGLIESIQPLRVSIDVAECIIPSASIQDGTLRCGRTDRPHLEAQHPERPSE